MTFSVTDNMNSVESINNEQPSKGKFPIINNRVSVVLKGFEHVFATVDGLYVHDVAQEDGELVTGFGGQQWNYLVSQIPQVAVKSWRIRRRVFLKYLQELEEQILKGNDEPFMTKFGMKKLEWTKAKESSEPGDEF
jgi:hypothetical protein